jgi:hypothetical protein
MSEAGAVEDLGAGGLRLGGTMPVDRWTFNWCPIPIYADLLAPLGLGLVFRKAF